MVRSVIRNPRVARSRHDVRGVGSWMVLHPSNDAILAYADTEEEARAFARIISDAEDLMYKAAVSSRLDGDFSSPPTGDDDPADDWEEHKTAGTARLRLPLYKEPIVNSFLGADLEDDEEV